MFASIRHRDGNGAVGGARGKAQNAGAGVLRRPALRRYRQSVVLHSGGRCKRRLRTQHVSRKEIEEQFKSHRGLFCKLFDSSCIDAEINLGNSLRTCSDRELLTQSDKVRTASSEVTRSGVQQAVLVAEVKNDQCSNAGLIDFIFNLNADGWKLFSIP